ncbi:hypothetical protein D3874_20970 [Oleomonas cavernae]|uniref:S1 motif domain-containing protein n=1 Tax=Oleomonas cavernae TaxID=2320859 RepID=A0A418WGP2_9PROT|nr:hypothetical protein [Oleomonas cavernae]RJF89142.1 hypothetical protein D3874_20970 [Oleomonas cavernae]
MTRRFVIEAGPLETRTALIEDGRAIEFHVFPQGRPSLVGEIRLGRVASVEKAMGALFVDIGLDRPAFLKLKDAGRPSPAEGAAIVVEIIREATGAKAARVTTRLGAVADPTGQIPRPACWRPPIPPCAWPGRQPRQARST